jgi:biotin carboxyl carrier protein
MKYLENSKFTELTAELSEAQLGQSHRVINGKLEAYTMKRAGTDKKYATALGQRYVAEMEELEQELAATVERKRRKRSMSAAAVTEVMAAETKKQKGTIVAPTVGAATELSNTPIAEGHQVASGPRRRSFSFDSVQLDSVQTTLGDFNELGTRRLMTDLILTLNASFPDYDFSNVKPSQFEKLTVSAVRHQIYERLSELATFKNPQQDWLLELWTAVNDVIDVRECDVYSFEEEGLLEEHSGVLWSFHYFFVNKSLRRMVFFTCTERIDEESGGLPAEEQIAFYPSAPEERNEDFDWEPSPAGGVTAPISTAE